MRRGTTTIGVAAAIVSSRRTRRRTDDRRAVCRMRFGDIAPFSRSNAYTLPSREQGRPDSIHNHESPSRRSVGKLVYQSFRAVLERGGRRSADGLGSCGRSRPCPRRFRTLSPATSARESKGRASPSSDRAPVSRSRSSRARRRRRTRTADAAPVLGVTAMPAFRVRVEESREIE